MFHTIIRLTLIFTCICTNVNAQHRIGLDIGTRKLDNLIFTFHFQSVIKDKWLYSVGVFSGSNGRELIQNNPDRLYSGEPIKSPFKSVNEIRTDELSDYHILDYSSKVRSFGVQFGLGYFFEFGTSHGLRVNLNNKIGYAESSTKGYYRSIEIPKEVFAYFTHYHFISALSLEVYHTIRLTGRLTFNYGFKIPYFYSIDKRKFNPTNYKDLTYGFEPELSIGLTRVIGKCD